MTTPTRRRFMRDTAVASAFLSVLPKLSASVFSGAPGSGRDKAWVTTAEAKLKETSFPEWTPESKPDGGKAGITIDPARKFQSVVGFGGAFTDASCYLMSRMDADSRRKLMAELVGSEGLELSMARTCIGASDYSRNAYSFDDSTTPDPELRNFSIAHDQEYILPVLREAIAANPELFVFSTPWSPPGWMKAGGSLLGGSMRKPSFPAYAEYFVKFLEAYKAEGVQVRAVTSQNEVDADQDGRMPACIWGQEYETQFVRDHLGPALEKAGLDTKIWILDHNYDLWGRAEDALSDPGLSKYVDGVAWHGYMGKADAMTRVHDAFPNKHAYWTEGGPDYTLPDYATDWAKWSTTFTDVMRNWAKCIVCWNVVLDEKGKPNIGPFDCGGLLTLDSKTQKLSRSGMYYAFAHYSKSVKRGATVIASTGDLPGVGHVAFTNPDGSHVLVLTNAGDANDVSCRFSGKMFEAHLPPDSVTTLRWS
jgi:glucosylceramidase